MKTLLMAFANITPHPVTELAIVKYGIEVSVGHTIYIIDKNGMVFEKHGPLAYRTAISELLTHNLRRELGYGENFRKYKKSSSLTLRKLNTEGRIRKGKCNKGVEVSYRFFENCDRDDIRDSTSNASRKESVHPKRQGV